MCAPADAGIVLDEWHKLEDGADASEEDPREPPSVVISENASSKFALGFICLPNETFS
jgi:hypothetical protein